MTRQPRQHGVVLITVLWIVAGLSMIVASSLIAARTDILLTRNQLTLTQVRSMAEAGIYWGIYSLLKPRQAVSPGLPEKPVHLSWDGAKVAIEISNESGRIDVNTASTQLIEGALLAAGVDARRTRSIIDQHTQAKLQASRTTNDVTGKTLRFETVEQFTEGLNIPALSRKRIASWMTVDNGRSGINPTASSREVLLTVPGMNERQVDAYMEIRRRWPLRLPDSGFQNRYFSDRLSSVYTIIATAELGGVNSSLVSKVKLSSLPQQPYTILQWRWSSGLDENQ